MSVKDPSSYMNDNIRKSSRVFLMSFFGESLGYFSKQMFSATYIFCLILVANFLFFHLPNLFQLLKVFTVKVLIFILQCSFSKRIYVNVHRAIRASKKLS